NKSSGRRSLNHPVSPQKHSLREGDALSGRRFEIEYQIEARRLLDRKVGWDCAFQDLVDEGGAGAVLLYHAEGVRHQAARIRKLILAVHSDLTLGVHQFHDTPALGN